MCITSFLPSKGSCYYAILPAEKQWKDGFIFYLFTIRKTEKPPLSREEGEPQRGGRALQRAACCFVRLAANSSDILISATALRPGGATV